MTTIITITLNGEAKALELGSTLAQCVADMTATTFATAINGEFVPKAARHERIMAEGEAVFTFQPIAGG